MNVGELKEALKDFPDHWPVVEAGYGREICYVYPSDEQHVGCGEQSDPTKWDRVVLEG